ncbi:MAG: hypothetical protein IKP46_00345 [Bacteroidales bacterium]|nr:hypothetical protein [Bacteroidales bacterium]
MKKRVQFSSPRILQEVKISAEISFLASVVDQIQPIESIGQEVKEYNFADETQFNHEWE